MADLGDLTSVVETSCLVPLDPTIVTNVLSNPPFHQVPGLVNVRSIPLPTSTRGLVLRSAETNHLTPEGKAMLHSTLGVVKIFDLRSPKERAKFGTAVQVPGVEVVFVPAMPDPVGKEDVKAMFMKFGGTKDGPAAFYRSLLESGKDAFKTIFEFLRDEVGEGKGCLINCAGGKDRTGVAIMLILDLVGTSDSEIINDYALTRIGGEPLRVEMMKRFQPLLDQEDDPEFVEALLRGLSSSPSTMLATLDVLRAQYGGAEGYLKKDLGFTDEDIQKIISNLKGGE